MEISFCPTPAMSIGRHLEKRNFAPCFFTRYLRPFTQSLRALNIFLAIAWAHMTRKPSPTGGTLSKTGTKLRFGGQQLPTLTLVWPTLTVRLGRPVSLQADPSQLAGDNTRFGFTI